MNFTVIAVAVLTAGMLAGCGGNSDTPTAVMYAVGGTVSGLAGSGLVLQDNGAGNLPVSANGSFTFATAVASGGAYSVTVLTQPSNPAQTCVVTGGSGTVTATVSSVLIACQAATAGGSTVEIDWTNVHQEIDGFGAADAQIGHSSTTANQAFFFGLESGQLGLSLLRVGVTDGSSDPGDCTSVGTSCAGVYISDMQAITANGGRVYASPWTPPAAYKTNGLATCSSNAGLSTADYGAYATWLANFVQSVQTESGITLYAISVQNEPTVCQTYDSAVWTAADIDAFVEGNLGPVFAANDFSTLIFVPESGSYGTIGLGDACGGDSACNQYVGGINWHDYDASLTGTNTVTSDPYPATWPAGKKYWETEASCAQGGVGPTFCQTGFNTDMTDALDWAAVIDQRIAVDGANAWLYWWLYDPNSDDEGLLGSDGTVPKRAYMLGQYSRFVRPGYHRIDATHLPQPAVSVSAYQWLTTNTLVIIATNYSSAAVSQSFLLENAPALSTLTPWMTSSGSSLAQQANVSVSSNSFTYTLPPDSITTFVGTP